MPGTHVCRRLHWVLVLCCAGFMAAGCASSGVDSSDRIARGAAASPSASGSHAHAGTPPAAVPVAALGPGERWVDLPMPGGMYRPQAETGGTDDYRCILLDPRLTTDSFLSGVALVPGNRALVHHAILYRVEPDQVGAAAAKDAQDPRLGWSCFGDPGLPGKSGVLGSTRRLGWPPRRHPAASSDSLPAPAATLRLAVG